MQITPAETLQQLLRRFDGKGYKAYQQTRGHYRVGDCELFIDHVQGDPFAAPSKVRVRVHQSRAGIPRHLFDDPTRLLAMGDFLGRSVREAIQRVAKGRRGTGKSGIISIDAGGQEVLQRTAVVLTPEFVEARIQVGLPADGRTIRGRDAREMLLSEVPEIAGAGLLWENVDQYGAQLFVHTIENYFAIRDRLEEMNLVAFVADGAVLPRESGVSDRPLARAQAVAFESAAPFAVNVSVPHPVGDSGQMRGMGIPKGVTLVVGGGYHGKSTLLRALERGVYPHVPGDGREYVVTLPDAVKIRSEDGRRIANVDISAFIDNLPYGRSTQQFSSVDASGSTSQAANIIEALEIGTGLLLLDEDTSATNFMVRDARMQALVNKDDEPITPFLDQVKALHDNSGVSTVLVMGGCGDYFDVADHVIMMCEYLPRDVTNEAGAIALEHPTNREAEAVTAVVPPADRIPDPESIDAGRGRGVKIDAVSREQIRLGHHTIDLRHLEQLVDVSQTRAVGHAIELARERFMGNAVSLRSVVERVDAFFDDEGLDPLDPYHQPGAHPGNYARPRKHELAAAINRLRSVEMKQK